MKNKKAIGTNITHKNLIITTLILIILVVLVVFVISKTNIINKMKQTIKKEEKPLFAYEVYDNQDENKIKVLVTVNSEDGIDYIIMPDETRINCYDKIETAIDYAAAKDSEGTFKIKEKDKEEKTETIKLDDQTLHDNGLALDETDQSGYKEFTISNKLQNLKEKFTSYSYKIGENGEWTQPTDIQNEIYKISELDYDLMQKELLNSDKTLNVYAKMSDSVGNTVIIKKNYNVDTTEEETTATSESLLKAVEDYDKGNGKYTVTVSDQTYNLKMYSIQGNLEIGSNVLTTIGNESDVATSTSDMAKNMVVLKVNGDLTIDENSTLTSYLNKDGYGGPKGMFIYCTGTITNNGEISQSGKGSHAEGQNVYLLKCTDGSYEYVPAEGATGGEGYDTTSSILLGNKGKDGSERQTGGAGAGNGGVGSYRNIWGLHTYYAEGGKGAAGTSYSGGISGMNGSVSTWYVAGNGWYHSQQPGTDGPSNGGYGAGGLLILYGNNVINEESGVIEASGINIKTTDVKTTKENNGGGSINIFSNTNYNNKGTIEANGSGSGGNGTVTINNLKPEITLGEAQKESDGTYSFPNLTIKSATGKQLSNIVIQFASEINSADKLTIESIDNTTITNNNTLILIDASNIDAATLQQEIRDKLRVSLADVGARQVSIKVGVSNEKIDKALSYYSESNHYYEFVSSYDIDWDTAKDEAEKRNYFGQQGYLATITSEGEQKFAASLINGSGWIGGTCDYNYILDSDGNKIYSSQSEALGHWYWVTGPEKGQALTYTNWASGEPNNAGNEYCLHMYGPDRSCVWNDYNMKHDGSLGYNRYGHIAGYIVEYGGMPNDTDVIDTISSDVITINLE